MISITDLPHLIVDNILVHAVYNSRMTARKFFLRYSQLLAVNSTWRYILLPRIYCKGYIKWKHLAKSYDLDTNLDLIISNKCSVYVKHIEILLSDLDCLAVFLHRYKNMFMFDKNNWKNVNNVHISMSCSTLPIPQLLYVNSIENCPGLSFLEFAEHIIEYCHNVQHLHLKFPDDSNTSAAIYSKFICAYSLNLISLSGQYISAFTDSTYLPKLTILSLDLSADVLAILPKINSRQLKHVNLRNIPLDFTWSAFYDSTNGVENVIVFENLKTLLLSFTEEDLDDEPQLPADVALETELVPFNVIFPVLSLLVLDNDAQCLSKHNYMFSKKLESMSIINSIGGLKLLNKSKANSILNLKITLDSIDPNNEAEFYSLTHDCFQLCSKICYTKIRLDMPHSHINWSRTEWLTLKRLDMRTCNIQTFLQILAHCSMVEYIELNKISFDDLLSNENTVPTHSSLSYLKMDSISLDSCSENDANSYIRCILINLTKLTTLNITAGRWLDLYDFTRLLGNIYPHLVQLNIKQYIALQ